jgi:hypothetical protein
MQRVWFRDDLFDKHGLQHVSCAGKNNVAQDFRLLCYSFASGLPSALIIVQQKTATEHNEGHLKISYHRHELDLNS